MMIIIILILILILIIIMIIRSSNNSNNDNYHNTVTERRNKAITSTSVDPLETLFLVAGKERFANTPLKERTHVDLPGDNSARGWSGISLVSPQSQSLSSVSKEMKDLIFKSAHVHVTVDEEDKLDDEEDAPADKENVAVPICPWEQPEEVFLELFNCFGSFATKEKNDNAALIVDLTPGSGRARVAAARLGRRYLGFCHNTLHAEMIRESVPRQNV